MSYQCLICLDEYPVGPVLTSCHHIYCYECLAKCNSNKCPTCRKEITQKNIQYFQWEIWLKDPDQTKFPKDYQSRSAKTYFQIHQKSKQNFSKELQQSAKLGHDRAIYHLGNYYAQADQIKEACRWYDKLPETWFKQNLGTVTFIKQNYQNLDPPNLKRIQQILELDQTANGWNTLGVFLASHGLNPQKEIECYKQALNIDPDQPCYLTNYGMTVLDPKKRFEIFQKSNNSEALCEISWMYLVGHGGEVSFDLAFEYMSKAQQQSNYFVTDELKWCEYGWGTPKNHQRVDHLFRQHQTQLNIAIKVWYYTQRQQFKKIREMEKIIQNANLYTRVQIGDVYRLGQGGPKDMKKAMKYYIEGYNQDHCLGIVRLASFPNEYQDRAWKKVQQIKIKPEFTKLPIRYSLDMYNPDVMFDIGKVFLNHDDFPKACQWFKKAKLYGSEKAHGVLDILQNTKLGKPIKRKNEST